MNITDKISKHYQSSIGGELKKMHVEEWDCDIFYRTTYPFKTEAKVIELQSQGKTVEALVESLITKALDQNGKRLFHDADRVKLMNEADPNVIVRLCTVINNAKLTETQDNIAKE